MKPIPWPALSVAIHRARHGDRASRELIAAHVDALVAETQAKQAPESDFKARMHALRERHWPPQLPRPVSSVAPPAPYQDPDDEETAA